MAKDRKQYKARPSKKQHKARPRKISKKRTARATRRNLVTKRTQETRLNPDFGAPPDSKQFNSPEGAPLRRESQRTEGF